MTHPPAEPEQLSFDFMRDFPAKPTDAVYESEEEALDALLTSDPTAEDDWKEIDPANRADCVAAAWLEHGVLPAPGIDPEPETQPAPQPADAAPSDAAPSDAAPSDAAPDDAIGPEVADPPPSKRPCLNARTLSRAALGFFAGRRAALLGTRVPLGTDLPKADAAAVFLAASSPGEVRPVLTALAVVCLDPAELAAPLTRLAKLEAALTAEKRHQAELEDRIRATEPELNDLLFPDADHWDYSRSRNRAYHRCVRRLERLTEQLAQAGKLQRLYSSGLGDEHWLVVPESLVLPDATVPEEWGILRVAPDLSDTVERNARVRECEAGARLTGALRIAAAGTPEVLFASGVSRTDAGEIRFHPLPKRRRAYPELG